MEKVRRGDRVFVITGKAKGTEGVIDHVLVKTGRVLIAGVNLVKRSQKAIKGRAGGIITRPAPLTSSKVLLICPSCGLKTRVGFRVDDKKKVRFCKKCQKTIIQK